MKQVLEIHQNGACLKHKSHRTYKTKIQVKKQKQKTNQQKNKAHRQQRACWNATLPDISILTLNVNSLNAPLKRYRDTNYFIPILLAKTNMPTNTWQGCEDIVSYTSNRNVNQ